MSQNAQTLLLFFDTADNLKHCFKLFKSLELGKQDLADQASLTLGIDVNSAWNDDWFNRSVSVNSRFLRIDYDTSSGYGIPLHVLDKLFGVGLKLACLEIFFDQVGEFSQHYFQHGKQISPQKFCIKNLELAKIINEEFACNPDDLEEYDHPTVPISQLIKDKEAHNDEALEMVDAIRELSKAVYKTGEKNETLLRDAMILDVVKSSLLKGIGFGVVTVLLFKGMWLWISLSVIITLALLVFGSAKVQANFEDEDESGHEISNLTVTDQGES